MSGVPLVVGTLKVEDYVVFALMLVVSTAIGVYYAWTSRRRESAEEFLTGGRRLTALPVSMSLTASFMSSITVLSNPAEVYVFGAIFVFFSVSYVASMLLVSEVYLPVFYRQGIATIYEYLELRFNRATRLLGTVLFIIQTILFTGIVIYGPALALSQVANIDLWGGIVTTGVICTLYCTLGGLKAVVWTDVFQMGIMIAGYVSVLIMSIIVQGGISTIISDSQQGGRLNFLDFDMNPLRRHTFWTVTVGGTLGWAIVNGTNQAQVQRYISCKTIVHARVSLYISVLGLCAFLVISVFTGMSLYSIFKDCDPWKAGLVSAPDQLMPYLVMIILTGTPGLPGLFFAAVCSGCLSTVSSSINAMAAVTVEDMIKPHTNISEKHLIWLSKGLSFAYGMLCISMAGLSSVLGGMMQAGVIVGGAIGGPLFGLFSLGILCPFANTIGGLSGLISGLVASLCLSIGSVVYPPLPEMTRPLPLTTDGCNFTLTESSNWTSTVSPTVLGLTTTTPSMSTHDNIDLSTANWHSPSYLYYGPVGSLTTFTVGLIVSLIAGGWKTRIKPELTLMKEDMLSYHFFVFMRDRLMRRTREVDSAKIEVNRCTENETFGLQEKSTMM